MGSRFVSIAAVALLCLASAFPSAGCSSPPDPFFGDGRGVAARGGDADGESGTMEPSLAYSGGAMSDATALSAKWQRQATVPVAGDTYQLVLGDASFLAADVVEEAMSRAVDRASAAAEKEPTPQNLAAVDATIERLRAYRAERTSKLVSTGRDSPGVVIFSGNKFVHGTTSADTPSPALAAELAGIAGGIADQARAAKGMAPGEKKPPATTDPNKKQ